MTRIEIESAEPGDTSANAVLQSIDHFDALSIAYLAFIAIVLCALVFTCHKTVQSLRRESYARALASRSKQD